MGTTETPTDHLPLTPLACRLCDALESIADTVPQAGMFTLAVRKQLVRNPVADEEITTSLVWIQEMIHTILTGSHPIEVFDFDETDIIRGTDTSE
jgi:hypothetical protein